MEIVITLFWMFCCMCDWSGHINNLYNTCFWNLVLRSGMTEAEANKALQGTQAAQKNEILFQKFQINYNQESAMFRKGSILVRAKLKQQKQQQQQTAPDVSAPMVDSVPSASSTPDVEILHDDVIGQTFWDTYTILQ
eukprot:c6232_g1_i1.p2 GENE.c6232_g1_i1~~c6232_g1_i1.p2  ORF type:complete len:137 (+),score=36.82 c6232_g1_i1:23-433(+)